MKVFWCYYDDGSSAPIFADNIDEAVNDEVHDNRELTKIIHEAKLVWLAKYGTLGKTNQILELLYNDALSLYTNFDSMSPKEVKGKLQDMMTATKEFILAKEMGEAKNKRFRCILKDLGGAKIPAIKVYREFFGAGLGEAKEIIESQDFQFCGSDATKTLFKMAMLEAMKKSYGGDVIVEEI